MFFGKKRKEPDPFWAFREKRSVYYDFFEKGVEMGFEMFLANGKEAYLKKLDFQNLLRYEGNKNFNSTNKIISVDAVYDRSGGIFFPSQEISHKVLNGIKFKKLCCDKFAMYKVLEKFMAKSFKIKNKQELKKTVERLDKNKRYVLKPTNGLGGKNITIGFLDKILNAELENRKEYVLQEFVDTSSGIDGIVKGSHDLRVVVVNRKIVWSHVRTPKKGTLIANVSRGGQIKELNISEIPEKVMGVVAKIKNLIDKKYKNPIYSIDFGVENSIPCIFELNDQIGFPTEMMRSKEDFINALLKRLSLL